MVSTNTQERQKTDGRLHLLGYLAAELIGIAAGFAVGKLINDQLNLPWLAAFGGLIVASIVAGGLLLLVCYLTGRWDDEVAVYFDHPAAECQPGTIRKRTLKTNRGLIKYILLSLITFNIYGIVALTGVGKDINLIAGKYDGKKTMNYCWIFFLLSGLTFGIAPIVWFHKLSARIGHELNRRGIAYSFGAGTFWGWNLLGLIVAIGPLVYVHKLMKAMNLLSAHYNVTE